MRLIDADALINHLNKNWYGDAIVEIQKAPTVDIGWKSIKKIKPNEGQKILYSYSYEYSTGKFENRVLIGDYTHSEKNKYPMCYMTHWTELPEPVSKVD